MLKEWNDSSKYYPRYRKIVSGNQNHIKPLLKALANASNSSLRRNADYSVSQMLNHNSSGLSHNFQN